MLQRQVFAAKAELKFVGDPTSGEIEGYGSVFGIMDSWGDQVEPGAFDATLAEHKANGTMPRMFAEHSAYMFGGDPLPIGKWTAIEPDEKGLRVKGKLIALEHPDVKRVLDLMREQEMDGLSIAWSPREGGVTKGKAAGEPKRYLKSIDLFSIDPVCDPANRLARIDSVKSMMQMPNTTAAAESMKMAHDMCQECMAGGDAPTADERQQIIGHIKTAYKHLTGNDMPVSSKGWDTIRQFQQWLHRPLGEGGRGLSNSKAKELADLIFKSASGSSGEDEAAVAALKASIGELRGVFSGFSLPKPGE
jgi:HK97 family phage prohead protease